MSPELVHEILLAAGSALAVAAAVQLWRAVAFLQHAVRTEGRVTRYTSKEKQVWSGEGRGSDTVRDDYPHVEFSLADGSHVEFRSRLPIVVQRGLHPGATVAVVYAARAPTKTAEIAGLRAAYALWSGVLAYGVGASGLFYLAAHGWAPF